jgi:flagellar secretion chaperone FliS
MKGVSSYQTQQLNGASPALLVAMLIEKAIVSLKEAIRAIESRDVQARWKANNRASEIINHLWLTLDTKAGGEIAQNLDQLYRFMMSHLVKVDMKNDPKPAAEVIELLEPLLESWRTLARRGEGAPARPAAAAETPAPSAGAMRLSA